MSALTNSDIHLTWNGNRASTSPIGAMTDNCDTNDAIGSFTSPKKADCGYYYCKGTLAKVYLFPVGEEKEGEKEVAGIGRWVRLPCRGAVPP
jgi:hypothetical protein